MSRVDEEEPFSCQAECIKATDAALLLLLETGEKHWVPRSVIVDGSEVTEEGQEGEVVIQGWFAEKEGIG